MSAPTMKTIATNVKPKFIESRLETAKNDPFIGTFIDKDSKWEVIDSDAFYITNSGNIDDMQYYAYNKEIETLIKGRKHDLQRDDKRGKISNRINKELGECSIAANTTIKEIAKVLKIDNAKAYDLIMDGNGNFINMFAEAVKKSIMIPAITYNEE